MRGTWAESFSLWLGSTGERLAADAGRLLGTHEAVLPWLGLGLVVFVVFFFSVFLCRRGRRRGGRQRGLAAAGKGGAIPAERSGEAGDEARPSGGAPRSPEDEASVRRRKERAAVKQVTKQQVNGKAMTPQSEREAVEKRRSSPVSAVRSPASPSQLEKTGEKTKKAKKKSKADQKHSSDLQDDETSNWETKVSVREKRQQKKEKRGKEQPGQLTPPVPTSTSAASIPDGPAKLAAAAQRSRPSNSAADHTHRREGSPNPKPSPVAINGGGGGSSTLGWVPPQAGRVPTASAWAEQGWASGSGTGSGLVAPSGTPCVDAESTTATARATLNACVPGWAVGSGVDGGPALASVPAAAAATAITASTAAVVAAVPPGGAVEKGSGVNGTDDASVWGPTPAEASGVHREWAGPGPVPPPARVCGEDDVFANMGTWNNAELAAAPKPPHLSYSVMPAQLIKATMPGVADKAAAAAQVSAPAAAPPLAPPPGWAPGAGGATTAVPPIVDDAWSVEGDFKSSVQNPDWSFPEEEWAASNPVEPPLQVAPETEAMEGENGKASPDDEEKSEATQQTTGAKPKKKNKKKKKKNKTSDEATGAEEGVGDVDGVEAVEAAGPPEAEEAVNRSEAPVTEAAPLPPVAAVTPPLPPVSVVQKTVLALETEVASEEPPRPSESVASVFLEPESLLLSRGESGSLGTEGQAEENWEGVKQAKKAGKKKARREI